MVLLLRVVSRHQKSCYLQAGELIRALENFCFGPGDGSYLPCGEESRNASVPTGLDRTASTPAPRQERALGVQAELALGTHPAPVPRSRVANQRFAALMPKEASKITVLWSGHPSPIYSGQSLSLDITPAQMRSHCELPPAPPS